MMPLTMRRTGSSTAANSTSAWPRSARRAIDSTRRPAPARAGRSRRCRNAEVAMDASSVGIASGELNRPLGPPCIGTDGGSVESQQPMPRGPPARPFTLPSRPPATSRARSPRSWTASKEGLRHQVLLGATGTGKTFTAAQASSRRFSGPRWSWPTTRRSPRSCTRSSASSSRRMRSSTSSATTTTTSPRPTCRGPIRTSRRIHPGTTRSIGCGTTPPARSSSGAT